MKAVSTYLKSISKIGKNHLFLLQTLVEILEVLKKEYTSVFLERYDCKSYPDQY